ncbi:MAG: cyclic pyranopterin monophosphate synthase MoaC [Gemmatimonadaceae bacterium]
MSDLSHVSVAGEARMVDVSGKEISARVARASGAIRMQHSTLDAIRANNLAKGDVLSVARIAGILAAKKTAELIPLCHPLPITDIQIEFELDSALPGVRVEATVRASAKTGAEMEAITAVSVTLITVYDMAKAVDRGMVITDISLQEKEGGKTGVWRRG